MAETSATAPAALSPWSNARGVSAGEKIPHHLKQLEMNYQAIADHIIGVARGQQKAMVTIPSGAAFSEDYRISAQAVHKAFRRAIARLPETGWRSGMIRTRRRLSERSVSRWNSSRRRLVPSRAGADHVAIRDRVEGRSHGRAGDVRVASRTRSSQDARETRSSTTVAALPGL
jgi:hypothetical protein